MTAPRTNPRDPVHAEQRQGEARARVEVPEWLQREADAFRAERRAERRWRVAARCGQVAALVAVGFAVAHLVAALAA